MIIHDDYLSIEPQTRHQIEMICALLRTFKDTLTPVFVSNQIECFVIKEKLVSEFADGLLMMLFAVRDDFETVRKIQMGEVAKPIWNWSKKMKDLDFAEAMKYLESFLTNCRREFIVDTKTYKSLELCFKELNQIEIFKT